MNARPVAGVLLAAGSGSRLGRPKALVELGGQRLVDRAVGTLRAGGCDPVIAVVRAGTEVPGARAVVNPDPDTGMGGSLVLGLQAARDAGADAAVVLLVDVPGVLPSAVRALAGCGAQLAVATYDGRRGHPVLIARAWWPEAVRLARGDQGARALLAAHPDQVVEVACIGDPADLDTPADLAAWQQRV